MGMSITELLLALANEVGRNRSFADDEIAVLARATQRSGLLKRWTEDEDDILRTMRANRATDRQIARELGRSVRAVESRIRNMKLRKERVA